MDENDVHLAKLGLQHPLGAIAKGGRTKSSTKRTHATTKSLELFRLDKGQLDLFSYLLSKNHGSKFRPLGSANQVHRFACFPDSGPG